MTLQSELRAPFEACVGHLGPLLEHALAAEPERTAFRFEGARMTRGALLVDATATAARLQAAGLDAGEPVAIQIEHSLDLAVALCGTLLAGGCAVPVDPAASIERRRAILADVAPRFVVVGDREGSDALAAERIEIARGASAECKAAARDARSAEDPAFIVYTSGSTGNPKGVVITHGSYAERMRIIVAASRQRDDDVDLAWTPSSFIGMLDEFFYPLLCATPAVIAEPAARANAGAFARLVAREGVTRFRISPSLLGAFLAAPIDADLAGVRAIFCSGETIPASLQRSVHERLSADLVGFYGATEAPGVAFHVYDRAAAAIETTICSPQPFAEIRIARPDGAMATTGEIGEIWIGGCAVARGYWGRPTLTAEKFRTAGVTRWYRTGDRGRLYPDGRVEILGRADRSEVNVHGVRIDVGDVRQMLESLDGVDAAWISVVDQGEGRDPALIGHCVGVRRAALDPAALRQALGEVAPMAAVPRGILLRDSLPLASNGKLDALALDREAERWLDERRHAPRAGADERPASPVEIAVLNGFGKILEGRRIGPREDFFEAGGTSLDAVSLACLLSEHFETDVSLDEIVLHPTARALSAHIERRGAGGSARKFLHVEGTRGPHLLAIGFGVSHLAGLWPDRRLHVSPGILGDPRVSFRKRLSSYIDEYEDGLRRMWSDGPFQLVGFSFSGLIAYELARRLAARGVEIAGVALIEPVTPTASRAGRAYEWVLMSEIARSAAAGKRQRLRALLQLAAKTMSNAVSGPASRTKAGYGHLVTAAERLEGFPGRVDLVYSDAFPAGLVERWRAALGDSLATHRVDAAAHTDLIKPECVAQWRSVIDRPGGGAGSP
jgi:amino acid adenylation domain-containing protein